MASAACMCVCACGARQRGLSVGLQDAVLAAGNKAWRTPWRLYQQLLMMSASATGTLQTMQCDMPCYHAAATLLTMPSRLCMTGSSMMAGSSGRRHSLRVVSREAAAQQQPGHMSG
jgi:hypothetical protein